MSRQPLLVERAILVAIVVAYVALGAMYAALTPPWQVPDEPAHYNYVRYLVEEKHLPVLQTGDYDQAYLSEITTQKFAPELSIDGIRYEFHQPPLYYLLLAPVYALSGGALLPLRLCTVALGAGILVVTYLVVKAIYPRRAWVALGAVALVALIPQHIAMTAGVENDAPAELILGLVLLRLVRWLQAAEEPPLRSHVVTGVIVALGLWTKSTAYIAVPLVVIAAALRAWRVSRATASKLRLRPALVATLAILIPALLLSLPWFIRNVTVYGNLDLLGLKRHDEVVVGQMRTSEWLETYGWKQWPGTFLRTTFRSFWAQFGWMAVPIDWRVYTALRMLTVAGIVGFIFRATDAWDQGHRPTDAHILLLCSGLLTVGTYLWYNIGFYQAQGRYLFPALIPISLAWALGIHESLQPKTARWFAAVIAIVTGYDIAQLLFGSHGDKWKVLIHGLGTGYWGIRMLLPQGFEVWLFAASYGLLGLLCAVSPFWFIVPNLTPQ